MRVLGFFCCLIQLNLELFTRWKINKISTEREREREKGKWSVEHGRLRGDEFGWRLMSPVAFDSNLKCGNICTGQHVECQAALQAWSMRAE